MLNIESGSCRLFQRRQAEMTIAATQSQDALAARNRRKGYASDPGVIAGLAPQ
jgi:hypothetical protein